VLGGFDRRTRKRRPIGNGESRMPHVAHRTTGRPIGQCGVRARLVLGAVLVALMPPVARAQQPSNLFCAGLWYERNAIFREAGYCFRTDRAIEAFGNDGCRYLNIEDVPLTRRQRAEVDRIRRWEREKGCTG